MQFHDIFLVRHGAYDYGTGRLNDKGREQSRQALRELVTHNAGDVALILSSDAPRALETSQIIADGLGSKIAQSKRIRLSALDPSGVESLDECISQSLLECGMPASEQLVVVAHEPLLQVAVHNERKNGTPHFENGAVVRYEPGTWNNLGYIGVLAVLLEGEIRS